jgi:hypothetical protein
MQVRRGTAVGNGVFAPTADGSPYRNSFDNYRPEAHVSLGRHCSVYLRGKK